MASVRPRSLLLVPGCCALLPKVVCLIGTAHSQRSAKMAGWKAAVAVALLLCLSLSVVDAASKQKKKAVVTHKVRAAPAFDLHTSMVVEAYIVMFVSAQVFFDIEIDGKPEGEGS